MSMSLIFVLFLDEFLMVVGGYKVDTVELLSPDPLNNPVPECHRQLKRFPKTVYSHAAAALMPGKT
jgi:hypothetical protein